MTADGPFRIRPARRAELVELTRLQAVVHADLYAPPGTDKDAYVEDSLRKAEEAAWIRRKAIVAEQDGRIVGVVKVIGDSIAALYVAEPYRRSGVGASLLAAAEARLRKGGIEIARLNVARGFPVIQAFYERHGWRPEAMESGSTDSVWGLPLIHMTKRIATVHRWRNQFCGWILKGTLALAAAAIIVLAMGLLHAGGVFQEAAAVAFGIVLGLFSLLFIPGVKSANYTVWRNILSVAALALAHALLMTAAWAIAALAVHRMGLTTPRIVDLGSAAVEGVPVVSHKPEVIGLALLMLLCPAADQLARRTLNWLWRRYVWLFA
jgi:GNAT superfamily N-acetyltransferase